MGFPLSDYIDAHADLPFSMGSSGMLGQLASTARILAGPRRHPRDVPGLVAVLAERVGVPSERLFLTHGATEANALVLFYLARHVRRAHSRTPRALIRRPEYPPLVEAADYAGFAVRPSGPADLWVRSDPHNPSGRRLSAEGRAAEAPPHRLFDETFREFTPARSAAVEGAPRTWVTGTLTKVYGADGVRLGWVVVPPEEVETYRRFQPHVADKIPYDSVRAALDLLEEAETVLRECRDRFERHRALLEARVPGIGPLAGPVAFDRPGLGDTERLAHRCLDRGVVVCPGRFFGDPTGVRLGLTHENFPEALDAYWGVRSEGVDDAATRGAARAAPPLRPAEPRGGAPSARRGRGPGARPARAGTSGRTARRRPGRSR